MAGGERMSANYPKYEAYKETGIEWLPQVPEGWEVKKFKYHAKVCNGKDQKAVLVEDGVYSIFGSGGEFGRANEYLYNKPSVLLGRKGTIDRPLFVDKPFWTVDTMFYTEISNKTYPRYFYYSCLGIAFDKYQMGSAIPSMTQEDLSGIEFPTPPLPEQKAIAAFLDEKTGKIDTLLAKLTRQKELLTEKRTALINRAVTRGLNPNAPMKETGIQWLPQVPEHWEVKKLKYIGKITSGNAFNSNVFTDKNTGCIAIKISNIQTMRMDWSDTSYLAKDLYNKFPNFQVYKGDLIFALTRPVISSGIKVSIMDEEGEYLLNQRNALLRTHNKSCLDWMYFIMLDGQFVQHFQSIIDTTGQQPNVSPIDIGNINIPLPPEIEQKEITDFLRKQTATIDLLQSKTDKQIELLKEYRTSLITSAVTGQIKVTDNQHMRLSA